jgi:hypothetical protein
MSDRVHEWAGRGPRYASGRIGAELFEDDSSTAGFAYALRNADVVHVMSHGTAAGLELADARATAAMIGDGALRCRLLVLASCSTADLATDPNALLWPLVRRGVNVLAPTVPIWDKYGAELLVELYKTLLPSRGRRGRSFADGLRVAVQAVRKRYVNRPEAVDVDMSLDGFMLYGNPTLYFDVVQPAKGASK